MKGELPSLFVDRHLTPQMIRDYIRNTLKKGFINKIEVMVGFLISTYLYLITFVIGPHLHNYIEKSHSIQLRLAYFTFLTVLTIIPIFFMVTRLKIMRHTYQSITFTYLNANCNGIYHLLRYESTDNLMIEHHHFVFI